MGGIQATNKSKWYLCYYYMESQIIWSFSFSGKTQKRNIEAYNK